MSQHVFDNLGVLYPCNVLFCTALTCASLYISEVRHQAAKMKDWHMVELLLQFGADAACRDSTGRDLESYLAELQAPDSLRTRLSSYRIRKDSKPLN